MSIKFSRGTLLTSVTAAAAALFVAAGANAHPYNEKYGYGDRSYSATDYGYDTSADVGGLTVIAPRRNLVGPHGWPLAIASVSRVVPTGDLDLSTGWGRHELRVRVESAADDACRQLDNQEGNQLIPLDDNQTCFRRAVDDAMSRVYAPY